MENSKNEENGTKNNPKATTPYVRIRLKPKEKKQWINFVEGDNRFSYLSELVRFCVREFLEMGGTFPEKEKKEDIQPLLKDVFSLLKEERREYMGKINEILAESKASKDTKIERKHKNLFLKLLKRNKYRPEDIADIYGLPEKYVIDVLIDLKQQGLIEINKNMEYEVKEFEE